MKQSTILSAFRETGLYLYNPSKVLDKLHTQEKEADEWEDVDNFKDTKNPENPEDKQPATPPEQAITDKLESTLFLICLFKRTCDNILATSLMPWVQHNVKKLVAVCTVLSYPSIGLGREVEGGLVLAGEECQGVRRGLVERGGVLQPRRNTVFIYSQEAADRILDRSTRQRDTGTSHVTGEINQGVLAAACICMNK